MRMDCGEGDAVTVDDEEEEARIFVRMLTKRKARRKQSRRFLFIFVHCLLAILE